MLKSLVKIAFGLSILVCSLMFVLTGCGGNNGTSEPTETPIATQEPTETSTVTPEPTVTVPEQESWSCPDFYSQPLSESQAPNDNGIQKPFADYGPVPGQIILTGPASHIEDLLELQDGGIDLVPIGVPVILKEDESDRGPLIAKLYDTGGRAATTVISEVYAAIIDGTTDAMPLHILVGHNWLIGTSWGVGVGPWGIDGDKLSGGTESLIFSSSSSPIPGEPIKGPWQQWALMERYGIDLYSSINKKAYQRTVNLHGEGVDVFIFDTSPFTISATDMFTVEEVIGRQLCVYHPELAVSVEATPTDTLVSEHGYFISGLVRLVAPNSRLHLIRVMNENGKGDVFSLLVALQQLKDARGTMENAVVNLSLSLFDTGAGGEVLNQEQKDELYDFLPDSYHDHIGNGSAGLAIEEMMREIHTEGAVIVAAVGNDSDIVGEIYKVSSMPAIFTTTVGVAGSAFDGTHSCFSNMTEKQTPCINQASIESCLSDKSGLLSPSGDGVEVVGKSCQDPFHKDKEDIESECQGNSAGYDCDYALVSVTTQGYAYWVGTSFGTPLVSGTAALMLGDGSSNDALTVSEWLRGWCGVLKVPAAVNFVSPTCP